jgi:hypothetical protein
MNEGEENALICARLLGWKQLDFELFDVDGTVNGRRIAPKFTTWAEAGLILEALQKLTPMTLRWSHGAQYWFIDLDYHGKSAISGPLAIRATALEYIKAVKS